MTPGSPGQTRGSPVSIAYEKPNAYHDEPQATMVREAREEGGGARSLKHSAIIYIYNMYS